MVADREAGLTRLDRYLVGRHLRAFAAVLSATCLVYAVIDFSDRSSSYTGDGWIGWTAELYGYRLLKVAALLSPVASLMAGGLTVSALRRRSEWVALLAAGLSPRRLIAPLAFSGVVIGVATAVFDDQVGVKAALQAERISAEHFHLWGSYAAYFEPKRWARVSDGILRLGQPLAGGGCRDVSLYRLSPDFTLSERIDAQAMVPLGGDRFRLDGARVRHFEGLQQKLSSPGSLELVLPAAAELFALAPGRPEMLSRSELTRQAEVRSQLGLPKGEQTYEADARIADAFAGCAGVLVAAALALRARRRGHLNPSLVEGIAIAAGLWALMAVFKSLSLAGRLDPWLCAFGPVGLIGAIGLGILYWQARAPPA